MTVTLRHESGHKIVKQFITRIEESGNYITLYHDRRIGTLTTTMIPAEEYTVESINEMAVNEAKINPAKY